MTRRESREVPLAPLPDAVIRQNRKVLGIYHTQTVIEPVWFPGSSLHPRARRPESGGPA